LPAAEKPDEKLNSNVAETIKVTPALSTELVSVYDLGLHREITCSGRATTRKSGRFNSELLRK